MSPRERAPSTTRLVAAMPAKDRARLLATTQPVDLPFSEVLVEAGSPIRDVYFPVDSYISLITSAGHSATIEIGLVGREGMFGESLALGVTHSPFTAVVQGSGQALRMSAAAFVREHARSAAIGRVVSRYLYVSMKQIAQSALCTRYHFVEARLARWLLMTHDRAGAPQFHVTPRFLPLMLGLRRAGRPKATVSFA